MNAEYQIAGFGLFRLVCYHHSNTKEIERQPGDCDIEHSPDDKYVRGYFMEWIEEPFGDGCMPTGIIAASFRNPHAQPAP